MSGVVTNRYRGISVLHSHIPMQRGRTGSRLKIKGCNGSMHRGLEGAELVAIGGQWKNKSTFFFFAALAAYRRIPF